jgi:predicted amidohydrolase
MWRLQRTECGFRCFTSRWGRAPSRLTLPASRTESATAASRGANCVLTPELCISEYQFADTIGFDCIDVHPDRSTPRVCEQAALHRIAIVLGHVERDRSCRIYNFAFVIGPEGSIVGCHRKVNTPAEPWACRATRAAPILFTGLGLGMPICSDACLKKKSPDLGASGAQMLIAPRSWEPGLHGPEDE